MKIIAYDDRHMTFYKVNTHSFGIEIDWDNETVRDVIGRATAYARMAGENLVLDVQSISDPIVLDDTTMKRIAKHNLSAENRILVKQKELAELELEQIKSKIDRFNAKYKEIIEFIDNDFKSADDDDYDDFEDDLDYD